MYRCEIQIPRLLQALECDKLPRHKLSLEASCLFLSYRAGQFVSVALQLARQIDEPSVALSLATVDHESDLVPAA